MRRTFLDEQIAGYEKQLQEAEAKRADFRSRYVDILPSEGSSCDASLDEARDCGAPVWKGQLGGRSKSRHDRLTQELAVTPATIVTETDAGTLGRLAAATPPYSRRKSRLRELQTTSDGPASGRNPAEAS